MTIEKQGSSAQPPNLQFVSQFKIDEIYKKNAFRLLQIPVTATDRDITRRKQNLEISRKTGAPVPDGPCKIFPLDPGDNHLDLNNLVDSLRDPVRRFYQEFFWFWPLSTDKNNPDPALLALAIESIDQAKEIWSDNHSDPREYAISLHNLAICNHFIALNNEYQNEQGESFFWQEAYRNWSDLSVLTDFWSLLSNRVREVNDPRLTHSLVAELRQSTLSIIAYSNAQEAMRLAQKDDFNGATALIGHILDKKSDFPGSDILKLAVSEDRERLLTNSSLVKQKAKNDPAHCDDAIDALLVESKKQLQVINVISTKETSDFKTLRSEITKTAFDAIETYMEKTDDWQRAIELVNKISDLPTNKKIEEQIKEHLESYAEFGEKQNYWHCKDYFNNGIPRDLFDELENAREAFDRQDYERTITILEPLLLSHSNDPNLVRKAIHPPLVMTLGRLARDLVGKAFSLLDTERSVIKRIFKNIRNKNQQCLLSLVAVKNNLIDVYSRRNQLYCCSCLVNIYGAYYTGEKDELKYIICERCYQKDRAELELIKKQTQTYFIRAKDLLTRANSLQPTNQVITGDLETVYDILEKLFNISKPKKEGASRAGAPPPRIPSYPPSSGVNEPKRKMSGGVKALIIIGIIAAIFACILIWDSNQNNTTTYPTSTSTPRPTAIPTKRPTNTAVVFTSVPSCRSWREIKASDAGKNVCVTGNIYDAYWGNNAQTVYYMTFSDAANSLRLEMLGGRYIPDIVNDCVIVEGTVNVVDAVPIIRIEIQSDGRTSNLYDCN